jgi:hypothetical protein
VILHILECDTEGCQRTSATPMEREWNAIAAAEEDGWYVADKAGGGFITYCSEHHPGATPMDGDVEIVTIIPTGSVLDMLAMVADIEEGDQR